MGNGRKTHCLVELADSFAEFIRRRSGKEVPDWITSRLKEIAAIDPNSTEFRYGKNRDSTKKTRPSGAMAGEFYVSLPHLQDAMIALNWALASVVGGMSTERMELLARQHAARRDFD
jgi:hypothetical protein